MPRLDHKKLQKVTTELEALEPKLGELSRRNAGKSLDEDERKVCNNFSKVLRRLGSHPNAMAMGLLQKLPQEAKDYIAELSNSPKSQVKDSKVKNKGCVIS